MPGSSEGGASMPVYVGTSIGSRSYASPSMIFLSCFHFLLLGSFTVEFFLRIC